MNHEEGLITAFVIPNKKARYLDFISNPKRRKRFIDELAHFKGLDPRFVVPILPREQILWES